jgi:hypothetical protein
MTNRTPLNPFRAIPNYKPVPKKRAQIRKGPTRDPEYLDWIRSLPCLLCCRQPGGFRGSCALQNTRTEAAHVGARGLGQKASDRETIPLCAYHHRIGATSHHTLQKHFWTHHRLDRDELVRDLNERYLLK